VWVKESEKRGSMRDYVMLYVLSGECMNVVLVCVDVLAGVSMMKMGCDSEEGKENKSKRVLWEEQKTRDRDGEG
jgi:hypothetical protein